MKWLNNQKGLSSIVIAIMLIVIGVIIAKYFMFGSNNNGVVNSTQSISNSIVDKINDVNSTIPIDSY